MNRRHYLSQINRISREPHYSFTIPSSHWDQDALILAYRDRGYIPKNQTQKTALLSHATDGEVILRFTPLGKDLSVTVTKKCYETSRRTRTVE